MTDPPHEPMNETTRSASAHRIDPSHPGGVRETCAVAAEVPVTLEINGRHARSFMCTPQHVRALAVGYALTDGIIATADDIAMISECPDDPGIIRMRLSEAAPDLDPRRDNGAFCGLSGSGEEIDDLLAGVDSVSEDLRLSVDLIHDAVDRLRDRQTIFPNTGGTHGAAVFSSHGRLVSFAEDVGRHNALDKAIGLCVLRGETTHGRGAALSSRISFELVAKCARAGIELIAAVSAPSDLALAAATRWNITLCAFVRDRRATVFTHPHRVLELSPTPGS